MPSDEPSSTTRTSYERGRVDSRCASVVENISGSRAVSLYAGMITERSSEPASCTEANGRRFEGLDAVRYVFSDGFGTMVSGDQRTRMVYACGQEISIAQRDA